MESTEFTDEQVMQAVVERCLAHGLNTMETFFEMRYIARRFGYPPGALKTFIRRLRSRLQSSDIEWTNSAKQL